MRRLVFAASILAFASGCGGSDDEASPPSAVVPFSEDASSTTRFGDIPFPSDLYRGPNGTVGEIPGLDRVATNQDTLKQGLAALDGFGRASGAIFFVDDPVDPESLPTSYEQATAEKASVFFLDVDESSDKRGTRYPAVAKYLTSLGCISVIPVPGVVLPPGVRHAAVLTNRVRTENGGRFVASDALSEPELYADALDTLLDTDAVESRSEVASLAVFTTSKRVEELPALRAKLRAQPEPSLILDPEKAAPYTVKIFGIASEPSLDDWMGEPDKDETGREWPGGDNEGGIAHDQIAVIASAAFVAPTYLDPSTKHFERGANGEYEIADANATIPVTIVIPKSPMPPGGYPVVINGHGLSNNRGSMFGVANELARAGFAMIGIDDVLHGLRGGLADEKNNYPGTYKGPDGIPDTMVLPIAFFAGFSDFVAVRDNFRQTVLDQTSLVRLIQSSKLDLSPLAAAAGGVSPKLDASRIYWSGGSLGGIMGSMTIAVEPSIKAAALQVPGAGFVQFITTNSADVAPLIGTLATGTFGVVGKDVFDEYHPVPMLLAAITEAGDPIGYASHVTKDPLTPERTPPDILVTYAIYDEVLPNISTIALIRAFGLEIADPSLVDVPGIEKTPSPVVGNLENGRTGAAVQYMPGNHGLGYGRWDTRQFEPGVPFTGTERFPKLETKIEFEQPIREHCDQLAEFFSSLASGGAATVRVTRPPVMDYDGDGALDEAEKAKGTDPLDPTSH